VKNQGFLFADFFRTGFVPTSPIRESDEERALAPAPPQPIRESREDCRWLFAAETWPQRTP
jgi:hypothetical protein